MLVITDACKDIVKETIYYIVVDYRPNQVKNAILQMKNNQLLKSELSRNRRKVFEEEYKWSIL